MTAHLAGGATIEWFWQSMSSVAVDFGVDVTEFFISFWISGGDHREWLGLEETLKII